MQGARYYKVTFVDKVVSIELAYDAMDACTCALIRRSSELDSMAYDEGHLEGAIVPRVKSVEGIKSTSDDSQVTLDSAARVIVKDMLNGLNALSKNKKEDTSKDNSKDKKEK